MKSVAQVIEHARQPLPRQEITLNGTTRSVMTLPDYQVKSRRDSPWHRRGAIDGETACGEHLDTNVHVLRGYVLDDKLCVECFTSHELELGIAAAEKARE